jgi:hypothetical protein
MSKVDLIALRDHDHPSACPVCHVCDAADEIERLTEKLEREYTLSEYYQEVQTEENVKLREALEKIAEGHTPYSTDTTEYFKDAAIQFRDTARAALDKEEVEGE